MKVTIPAKILQRIRQVAKGSHSQNVNISINPEKQVCFEICETKQVIKVDNIKKGGEQ